LVVEVFYNESWNQFLPSIVWLSKGSSHDFRWEQSRSLIRMLFESVLPTSKVKLKLQHGQPVSHERDGLQFKQNAVIASVVRSIREDRIAMISTHGDDSLHFLTAPFPNFKFQTHPHKQSQ
jgi:hypothetical protein